MSLLFPAAASTLATTVGAIVLGIDVTKRTLQPHQVCSESSTNEWFSLHVCQAGQINGC